VYLKYIFQGSLRNVTFPYHKEPRNLFLLRSSGFRLHNLHIVQYIHNAHYHCLKPQRHYSLTTTTLYSELEMYRTRCLYPQC